jgi:hypothetical protein
MRLGRSEREKEVRFVVGCRVVERKFRGVRGGKWGGVFGGI